MADELRTGVYICQRGTGIAGAVDLPAVARYAKNLPNVVTVILPGEQPQLDPNALADDIRSDKLERVVIAGDSPGYFKPVFTRAMVQAGGDPENVVLASFREHGASLPNATDRAKAVLNCAVHGVPYGLMAVPSFAAVNPDTLVIGGGVAGIQAALEIANAGKKVFLIEKTGTIGGHMAMFDKTFPTLDCAACILTPKMVAVGQHKKIELLTCSEVESLTGTPGAYKATIRSKARRVDEAACVACNACSEICPTTVPSEFDNGISTRKAIYMPFPQAVPNAFLVDGDACLYVQSGGKKCGACVKKCNKEAIHLDAQDQIVELTVGNVIVATGYDVLDARRVERYGYGVLPNVLTALEFERLTNASGPTGGQIVMKTLRRNQRKKTDEWVLAPDGPKPKSVAIIHCIGSRDKKYNPYCSRVCCMYSLKFAHLVREKLPEAACYEFYIDMRAFGKGYEDFFRRIEEEGVYIVRGRSAKIEGQDGRMTIKGEAILEDKVLEFPVDMVILSVGITPTSDSERLARALGIARDEDGWFCELDYDADSTGTESGGIYIAGTCQGPKDIPDTVAQASGVAARVIKSITSGHVQRGRRDVTLADIESRVRARRRRGTEDRTWQSEQTRG